MISVILEDGSSKELARTELEGNESFLLRQSEEFEVLSQLTTLAYDVFSQTDMVKLIKELDVVQLNASKEVTSHIAEIRRLAVRCQNEQGTTLTFTPFQEE